MLCSTRVLCWVFKSYEMVYNVKFFLFAMSVWRCRIKPIQCVFHVHLVTWVYRFSLYKRGEKFNFFPKSCSSRWSPVLLKCTGISTTRCTRLSLLWLVWFWVGGGDCSSCFLPPQELMCPRSVYRWLFVFLSKPANVEDWLTNNTLGGFDSAVWWFLCHNKVMKRTQCPVLLSMLHNDTFRLSVCLGIPVSIRAD